MGAWARAAACGPTAAQCGLLCWSPAAHKCRGMCGGLARSRGVLKSKARPQSIPKDAPSCAFATVCKCKAAGKKHATCVSGGGGDCTARRHRRIDPSAPCRACPCGGREPAWSTFRSSLGRGGGVCGVVSGAMRAQGDRHAREPRRRRRPRNWPPCPCRCTTHLYRIPPAYSNTRWRHTRRQTSGTVHMKTAFSG